MIEGFNFNMMPNIKWNDVGGIRYMLTTLYYPLCDHLTC